MLEFLNNVANGIIVTAFAMVIYFLLDISYKYIRDRIHKWYERGNYFEIAFLSILGIFAFLIGFM